MNKLQEAIISQYNFTAQMEQLGYETQTTFYQDFSIAEIFGVKAVKETYDTAFAGWKSSVVYITELNLVLNHKIWEHYHAKNEELSILYDLLWKELDKWCVDNLKGSDLEYFLRVTD